MIKISKKEKDLIRRYLVWCYKTTKESLDRIDRYFTQLIVDKHILKSLRNSKVYRNSSKEYKQKVNNFEKYMENKRVNVLKKKFKDKKCKILNEDYEYLNNRFQSIEKAICHFLGKAELEKINSLYEQEMTKRILETRDSS